LRHDHKALFGGQMKKKRKHLFSIIYIGITIVVVGLIAIFNQNIEEVFSAIASFSVWWLVACIGVLLLYWLTDALLLHDITSYMYKREPFLRSLKVGIIGLYYGAITPFATGGQPMQVVYMRRNNIPVGTATCIVCIKFVVYELSLCAMFIASMAVRGSYYYANYNEVFWFATLGFVFNLIAVFAIILTIINKKLVLRTGEALIRLLSRARIIKNDDNTLVSFSKTIDDYHTAAAYISRYKLRAIGSFFISVFNLAFFFAIPYFIYLAFGNRLYSLIDILTLQALAYLAVSFFPTPGSAGAAEGGFLLFFGPVFGKAVYIAMLIWRFFTYYLMLIVGSLLVVLEELFSLRRRRRETLFNDIEES